MQGMAIIHFILSLLEALLLALITLLIYNAIHTGGIMRGLRRTIGCFLFVGIIHILIAGGHELYNFFQESKYVNECSDAIELTGLTFLFDNVDKACSIEYKNNERYITDKQYDYYKEFNSLSDEELQNIQNNFMSRVTNKAYFLLHKDEIINSLSSLISGSENNYTNSNNEDSSITDSHTNESPAPTAQCNDETYSYSQNRQGTCSHHGGVYIWY